jgi:acyl-CoA thioesterase
MSSFEDATAVFRNQDGAYEASIDGKWWVFRGPHGGYLTAIILRALTELVDDEERSVRSFTTHFVAPPKEGPVEVAAVIERSGRSITYVSARLVQNGETMATSVAAFAKPWESDISFDFAPAPEVPSVEESTRLPDSAPMLPTFVQNFDMYWAIGPMPYSGSEETTVGGWLRLKEVDRLDAPAIACLLDAWAPAVLPRATGPVVAPTIDITMHFRRPLPPTAVSPDDHFLFRLTSRIAHEGYFEEDGELWGPGGELVAQVRQLAIALPIR